MKDINWKGMFWPVLAIFIGLILLNVTRAPVTVEVVVRDAEAERVREAEQQQAVREMEEFIANMEVTK